MKDNLRLMPRKWVALLLACGAVLAGVIYFWPQNRQAIKVPDSAHSLVTGRAVMPKGYQQNWKIRDPFVATTASNSPTPNNLVQSQPKPVQPSAIVQAHKSQHSAIVSQSAVVKPKLVGIVSAQDTKRAILSYQGSQSYGLHDTVGEWEVTAIQDDSVTLVGTGGTITLVLGR